MCVLLQMYRSSRDIFFLHSPWRKLKQAEGCTGVLLRDLKCCCLAIQVSHTLVQGSEASNLWGHTKAAKSHQETHGTETPEGLKRQPRTQSHTLVPCHCKVCVPPASLPSVPDLANSKALQAPHTLCHQHNHDTNTT